MLLAAAAVLLAVPIVLGLYWGQLPEAPACPLCRAITHRLQGTTAVHRLLVLLPTPVTAVRGCSRCGWQGRMRWRWAPHRVRGEE